MIKVQGFLCLMFDSLRIFLNGSLTCDLFTNILCPNGGKSLLATFHLFVTTVVDDDMRLGLQCRTDGFGGFCFTEEKIFDREEGGVVMGDQLR